MICRSSLSTSVGIESSSISQGGEGRPHPSNQPLYPAKKNGSVM